MPLIQDNDEESQGQYLNNQTTLMAMISQLIIPFAKKHSGETGWPQRTGMGEGHGLFRQHQQEAPDPTMGKGV